jgi:hypothetical protein
MLQPLTFQNLFPLCDLSGLCSEDSALGLEAEQRLELLLEVR